MPTNIFQEPAKSVPRKADSQIVRVDMEQMDLGGRKSHMPATRTSNDMGLAHVPNAGSKT